MSGPRIAVLLGLDLGRAGGGMRPGRDTLYLDTRYPEALETAGAVPVLVPPGTPEAGLEGAHGLLIPGGDDFPPPPEAGRSWPDDAFTIAPETQRRSDARLLAAARERGLPVLGICYGMQLLALGAGGRLVYDLPTERPEADPHGAGEHPITCTPGSRLAGVFGTDPITVNSRHHQAVADPGDGFVVAARSRDGVIEGIEAATGFAIGVQWHPEDLGASSDRLFAAFVSATRERQSGSVAFSTSR